MMNIDRIQELVKAHDYFMAIIATEDYERIPVVELRNKEAITTIIIGITTEIYEIAGIPMEDPESCFKFINEIKEAMSS